MADEALTELAGAFRAAAIGLASVTFDEGRGEQRLTVSEAGEYADALESALSELARLRAERDWRDISTAPWSGPPVLLWKPSTNEHYVAARIRGEHGPGWCTPDGYEIFRATHWQPLPAPPVQSHEEKQG